jgi:hypothetical protein
MKGKRIMPFLLLAVIVISIAAATLVEEAKGTEVAHRYIYGSAWFKLLWAAVVASGGWLIWKTKLWRRAAVFMLHLSFVIILAGALVTSIWGRKGTLQLRQGIPQKEYYCFEKQHNEPLPYYVRLDSFEILYYPGTEAPRDYVSRLNIEGQTYTISMNHIVRLQGFRLYQ